MNVLLTPIIKGKTLDPSISSNHRPIAIPTAASKLLEMFIQQRIADFLQTAAFQFGFKANHGTDLAIFSFGETVRIYTLAGSPVFVCFLDASKAFVRLNHRKLFKILTCRGVPTYLVQFLSYWYANQLYAVKWGNTISTAFGVSNGIRQGGLISPSLYYIYTDGLNQRWKDSKIGCHIADECVNHLSYADDMVLLGPSVKALQMLMNICTEFAVE